MSYPPATQKPVSVAAESALKTRKQGLSVRALVIGCALIPLNMLWMTHIEHVRYSDNVSTSSLFFNAISLLLALTLVNAWLARLFPKRSLSRSELLVIYVMVVIATGLAGHDSLQILFLTISYIVRNSGLDPGWSQTILPNLPHYLLPPSGPAVDDLFTGGSTLYSAAHYMAWIKPLAWWSSLVFAVVWVMLCIAAIFRRQWENERLTFPIAEIPLQITDPKTQIFRSRLFWAAFALAAGARLWVVAQILIPSIPELPINVRYYPLSADLPWSEAGVIPISFFPFAIGMSFFLPTQMSFSVWFFFIVTRLERVAAAAIGHQKLTGLPYVPEQGVGAAIGLAAAVIWYARRHLGDVARHALGRAKLDDSGEPLSYKVAFWGLALGLAYLVFFAAHAGMRPLTATAYMVLLLMLALAIARIRAEVGLPSIEMYQNGADAILRTGAGDAYWSRGELTVMSLFFWLSRTHRQFPMYSHVDAMRMAERGSTNQRSMTKAILIASAVAIIAAFWAYLHVMYQVGYDSAKFSTTVLFHFGNAPWQKLHTQISMPQPQDFGRVGAYIFGAAFSFFLGMMRARYAWWPFHPAGYFASSSFGLFRMWIPVLIAWAIKATILRFGGSRAYHRAIPFFIGLIAGEFVIGMLTSLLNVFDIVVIPPSAGIGGL